MSETCPECGGAFASPTELLAHREKTHAGGDARASLAMNAESHTPGLVCALCGERFSGPQDLARHNLQPHPPVPGRRAPSSHST